MSFRAGSLKRKAEQDGRDAGRKRAAVGGPVGGPAQVSLTRLAEAEEDDSVGGMLLRYQNASLLSREHEHRRQVQRLEAREKTARKSLRRASATLACFQQHWAQLERDLSRLVARLDGAAEVPRSAADQPVRTLTEALVRPYTATCLLDATRHAHVTVDVFGAGRGDDDTDDMSEASEWSDASEAGEEGEEEEGGGGESRPSLVGKRLRERCAFVATAVAKIVSAVEGGSRLSEAALAKEAECAEAVAKARAVETAAIAQRRAMR